MANWEPHHHPPRTSSRFPAPGIFVNVEFGVTFSNNHRPHTAAVKYTSRRMQEKLARQRRQEDEQLFRERDYRQQQEEQFRYGPHPSNLMPGIEQNDRPARQQQQRQQRLHVRTRDLHERGSSAPPSITDRNQPISPITPIQAIQHTSSMPLSARERPLPPVPSRFRLGEDGLPWSTEPWYRPDAPEYPSPTMVDIENENRRGEDPQRVRDLEALHQAMMTVDSLPNDGWEAWTWESVGDMPRGPRSLGWAVSTAEQVSRNTPVSRATPISPPPPYVVSQWEESFGWGYYGNMRPRSSG